MEYVNCFVAEIAISHNLISKIQSPLQNINKMDRGLISFCARKQDNFARFASFVDKKIKSGELKGNDEPLNKDMWDETRREKAEYDAEMASFTAEQKQFYSRVKRVGRNNLDSFFGKKEIQKPKQIESKTKLGRLIPIFD